MPGEIRLDKKMFEVLSSDTRRKILVNLNCQPLTVSDLTKFLGIQKSAVHEHLKILMDVQLVYKKESNNEFVYYDLTEKGKVLVNQESNSGYRIFIAFSASVVSLIGGLTGITLYTVQVLNISLPTFNVAPETPTITPIPTLYPTSLPTWTLPIATVYPTVVPITFSTFLNMPVRDVELIIGIILLLLGLVLLYYSLNRIKSNKFYKLSIPFIHR